VTDNDVRGAMPRDLAWLIGATLLAAALSVRFELSETLLSWTRPWERYQLDELPGILLFVAVALAWFAWRRASEARAELARRRAAERELAGALDDNRRLARSYVKVQEDERKSLARELHDELGQHLNAIKVDAVSLRECAGADAPEVRRAAASIVAIADHVHAVVRDMTRRLRPAGLDELGLAAALENYVEGWRARSPRLRLDLTIDAGFDRLGEALDITLYRLAQEGLTNVSKHANAQRIELRLERAPAAGRSPGQVVFTLADDGVGTHLPQHGGGLGLTGMRERVEALGGRMEVTSAPGRGFRIVARLPLEAAA